MPNRRTFDLVILTLLLWKPAYGLVRMAARRWSSEAPAGSPLEVTGNAVAVVG